MIAHSCGTYDICAKVPTESEATANSAVGARVARKTISDDTAKPNAEVMMRRLVRSPRNANTAIPRPPVTKGSDANHFRSLKSIPRASVKYDGSQTVIP